MDSSAIRHNYGEINMVDIRTENEALRRKNALLVDHLRKYLSLGAHLYYTTIDEGADWARKTRELLDSLGGGIDENKT